MPSPPRARRARLAALVTLPLPVAGCVLLLTPDPAPAAGSPFTITCPASDGSAGGPSVTGPGQTCGTYSDAAAVVVTASCQPVSCLGAPTFAVTSPSGATLFSDSLGADRESQAYTVPTGSPDGTYTASLTGGGADVSTTFLLAGAAASGPAPAPSVTGVVGAPSTSPTNGPSTPAASTSAPSADPSSAPPTAGAAPSSQSGHGAASGGGRRSVAAFPAFRPPAGIATLPALPPLPAAMTTGESGVTGPYGTTLPYGGSVTVAQRAGKPTVFSHVADTFDNRQVAESVAAASLALLLAAHLRRFTRRPSGDAEL